jgi:4-amino-4-deoxy-L-arabinose transferase-like glycosyltransferase
VTLNNRQPLCAGAAAQRFGHSGDIRSALDKATLGALFWVIAIALLLRVTFYTGGMGSLEVAVRLLYGESVRTDYIGGIRYGFEIPAAFFLWLFGPSEISANIWSMVSSLLEVALIFLCALLLWGRRPAVLAGLVAAFLPQHVNIAGRMAADSPLALFITLSFVCFLIGELRSSKRWFFAAGLAVGAVFWVKHAVVPFAAAFLLYPIAARKWDWKWYWCVVGALLMLIGNSLLMWHMQGDPFHVFRIVGQGLGEYWPDRFFVPGSVTHFTT